MPLQSQLLLFLSYLNTVKCSRLLCSDCFVSLYIALYRLQVHSAAGQSAGRFGLAEPGPGADLLPERERALDQRAVRTAPAGPLRTPM